MPICKTCAHVRVESDGSECSVCAKHTRKNAFLENTVREFLSGHEDLKLFTYADTAIPCAPTKRRPDFCYVLPDRLVILEVDESEHRYNSLECETRREYELLDAVPAGKHLVIVRFNPNPSRSSVWSAFERLGAKLREAFVTDDVHYTQDGIHRVFINYSTDRKRKLAQTVAADQLAALRSPPGAHTPDRAEPASTADAPAPEEGGQKQQESEAEHLEKHKLYSYHLSQARKLAAELGIVQKAKTEIPRSGEDPTDADARCGSSGGVNDDTPASRKKYTDFDHNEEFTKIIKGEVIPCVYIKCPYCKEVCAEMRKCNLPTNKATKCLRHLRMCAAYRVAQAA